MCHDTNGARNMEKSTMAATDSLLSIPRRVSEITVPFMAIGIVTTRT